MSADRTCVLVEMPGVEPGSEILASKPTTRVFGLQVLVVSVTDQQVCHYQHQCCLALRPHARLHASQLKGYTGVLDNWHSKVRWHGRFIKRPCDNRSYRQLLFAGCINELHQRSSARIFENRYPVESGTSPNASWAFCTIDAQ